MKSNPVSQPPVPPNVVRHDSGSHGEALAHPSEQARPLSSTNQLEAPASDSPGVDDVFTVTASPARSVETPPAAARLYGVPSRSIALPTQITVALTALHPSPEPGRLNERLTAVCQHRIPEPLALRGERLFLAIASLAANGADDNRRMLALDLLDNVLARCEEAVAEAPTGESRDLSLASVWFALAPLGSLVDTFRTVTSSHGLSDDQRRRAVHLWTTTMRDLLDAARASDFVELACQVAEEEPSPTLARRLLGSDLHARAETLLPPGTNPGDLSLTRFSEAVTTSPQAAAVLEHVLTERLTLARACIAWTIYPKEPSATPLRALNGAVRSAEAVAAEVHSLMGRRRGGQMPNARHQRESAERAVAPLAFPAGHSPAPGKLNVAQIAAAFALPSTPPETIDVTLIGTLRSLFQEIAALDATRHVRLWSARTDVAEKYVKRLSADKLSPEDRERVAVLELAAHLNVYFRPMAVALIDTVAAQLEPTSSAQRQSALEPLNFAKALQTTLSLLDNRDFTDPPGVPASALPLVCRDVALAAYASTETRTPPYDASALQTAIAHAVHIHTDWLTSALQSLAATDHDEAAKLAAAAAAQARALAAFDGANAALSSLLDAQFSAVGDMQMEAAATPAAQKLSAALAGLHEELKSARSGAPRKDELRPLPALTKRLVDILSHRKASLCEVRTALSNEVAAATEVQFVSGQLRVDGLPVPLEQAEATLERRRTRLEALASRHDDMARSYERIQALAHGLGAKQTAPVGKPNAFRQQDIVHARATYDSISEAIASHRARATSEASLAALDAAATALAHGGLSQAEAALATAEESLQQWRAATRADAATFPTPDFQQRYDDARTAYQHAQALAGEVVTATGAFTLASVRNASYALLRTANALPETVRVESDMFPPDINVDRFKTAVAQLGPLLPDAPLFVAAAILSAGGPLAQAPDWSKIQDVWPPLPDGRSVADSLGALLEAAPRKTAHSASLHPVLALIARALSDRACRPACAALRTLAAPTVSTTEIRRHLAPPTLALAAAVAAGNRHALRLLTRANVESASAALASQASAAGLSNTSAALALLAGSSASAVAAAPSTLPAEQQQSFDTYLAPHVSGDRRIAEQWLARLGVDDSSFDVALANALAEVSYRSSRGLPCSLDHIDVVAAVLFPPRQAVEAFFDTRTRLDACAPGLLAFVTPAAVPAQTAEYDGWRRRVAEAVVVGALDIGDAATCKAAFESLVPGSQPITQTRLLQLVGLA